MKGLPAVSRVQLGLAILMYLGAAGWMAFIGLGLVEILSTGYVEDYPVWQGAALFAVILLMSLMPKLMGIAGILADGPQSRRYGGRMRVWAGGGFEIFFPLSLPRLSASPSACSRRAYCLANASIGVHRRERTVASAGSRRRSHSDRKPFFGPSVFALLYFFSPVVLPSAMPVIAGFVLSIPFAA